MATAKVLVNFGEIAQRTERKEWRMTNLSKFYSHRGGILVNRVYILCQRYLDLELDDYTIGGIQTYIKNLVYVIQSINAIPVIIQYANKDYRCIKDGVTVIGVDTSKLKHIRHKNKKMHEAFDKEYATNKGLLLYATEGLVSPKHSQSIPTIAIQHGISWDKPRIVKTGVVEYEFRYWYKALFQRITLKKIENVKKLICVDYNYINWYRSLVAYPKFQYEVIPNFTEIPKDHLQKADSGNIKIIFARRFFEYRGTRIFGNAINKLLANNSNINVTIAGDGPDENWLREHVPESNNVHYTKYDSHESLMIHSDKHIAVVPTIGSEGTSLSLLEAMASKCAVVCTNVGGMTNIVIDGYNGLMINPNENDLYQALKRLVDDQELRNTLSERAFETVVNAFSYERWANRWKSVFEECMYE